MITGINKRHKSEGAGTFRVTGKIKGAAGAKGESKMDQEESKL